MNYELLKKLKDAGFPFVELAKQAVGNSDHCIMCGKKFIHIDGQVFLEPELFFLIEACGGNDFYLGKFPESFDGWKASNGYDRGFSLEGIGSTPEEAVANLYLELKK